MLGKHARATESRHRIQAMVELAASEREIVASPDEFDGDEWLFNVINGTIDLRTGIIKDHSRSDFITKLAPVRFDLAATSDDFLSFLESCMGGNASLISCLQRFAGYSLTGSTREQCFFIFWGAGSNGKTTFLEALASMLGDYAKTTPAASLMAQRDEKIPNDIARLKGARLVTANETDDRKRLSEALIKDLSGGDTITARFLHKECFEFRPKFKIVLRTNHRPIIGGTDHAMWRRIRLVPWDVTIPDDKQDRDLPAKLKAELSGILNGALKGCLEWQNTELQPPPEVMQATESYRLDMDVVGQFIQDRITKIDGAETPKSEGDDT